MPTALERQGDFSQTIDNLGNLYPFIKDPQLNGVCSAASQAACFADGGVRRPDSGEPSLPDRPEHPQDVADCPTPPARPVRRTTTSSPGRARASSAWQPAVRIDYQPTQTLRASFKYSGWQQRNQVINGSLPGFNDTKMQRPVVSSWVTTVNYNMSPTTFLEATYGRSQDELAGCANAQQSTGPLFCTSAIPMGPTSGSAKHRARGPPDALPATPT